ncbi:MAG TPA: hypothetical protein DCP92_10805 [Nitrospiraceae bacterium]|nr:hypothetical protein [Nitrospiraceae bacterium]
MAEKSDQTRQNENNNNSEDDEGKVLPAHGKTAEIITSERKNTDPGDFSSELFKKMYAGGALHAFFMWAKREKYKRDA